MPLGIHLMGGARPRTPPAFLPIAIILGILLMGEFARVEAKGQHGYDTDPAGRPDGVPEGSPIEWEVELFDFDRPSSAEDMSASEVLEAAGALKTEGNALFQNSR